MKRKVRLTEEADRHLTEAAPWYERQRADLGHEFLDEVLSALPLLAEHPSSYPVVHSNIRRAPMRRFPYGLYFRVGRFKLVVVAVIHARRRPRRWLV
jgi:plasmid stabilization system protein ParE